MFPVINVVTVVIGDSSTNNFIVKHFFTGNVTEMPKVDENKITVCKDTNVSITVTDDSGIPTVSALTSGISCNPAGCTINSIQSRQRYRAISADTRDRDTMQIRVFED